MKSRILLILPLDGGSLTVGMHVLDALKDIHDVNVDIVATQALHSFYEKSFEHIRDIQEKRKAIVEHINLAAMGRLVHFKPDLVLVMALAPITPWFLDNANALGTVTAHWYVENYRYYPSNPIVPPWQITASNYQHFFTIQKGDFHKELRKTGVGNCHYLPTACNPKIHHVKERKKENGYRSDIGFVGFHYPNRVAVFEALTGLDIGLWGPGWQGIKSLKAFARNPGNWVDGQTEGQILREAKIGLNIHSSLENNATLHKSDYLNPRVFTIPACGTFQLVDDQEPLGEVYEIGYEVETYHDLDSLKRKATHYLEDEQARTAIAKKGYERTMDEHTYGHRMNRMLKTIGLK